jgi:3-hydroxyisobutyrate dehydrogenase-like beta-hydroxyacid dehydrogenase
MPQSVAVIGVGAMGAPMARRIHAAGFNLTVCDKSEEALAPFAKSGVPVTRKPSDCSTSDIIIVLVATPGQLRDVVLGEHGIKSGLAPGQSPILVVSSTVPPGAVHELQESLKETAVRVVDVPISGGVVRAEHGTLTIIMGGEAADVESVKPVFATLGTQMFYCGGTGAAQTMKIVNNILGVVNYLVVAEAYRLAVEHGLTLADTTQVLEVSTGRNFLSADVSEVPATFSAYTKTRRDSTTLMSILRKDIGLALELASESQGEYPVIAGLMPVLDSLDDETFENWAVIGALRPS